MVGHNWFLPEVLLADGQGVPLSIATSGQFRELPLYGGQPCGALVSDGAGVWRTSLDASGIVLHGIGEMPVRIELPGGVQVVAEIALRPEEYFKSLPTVTGAVDSFFAVWLRAFVDGALAGEAWMEWVVYWQSGDEVLPWYGGLFSLSAGWHGDDGEERVYAHLLPSSQSGLYANNIGFPTDATRQFGIGASLEFPLPGVYPGPGPIAVRTAGPLYIDPYVQPCAAFTGHILPLRHTLPYLPDSLTTTERLDAYPDSVFGWSLHPSVATIDVLRFSLFPSEADNNHEWSGDGSPAGPRHLGALAQYPYSDHAVVPNAGDAQSNLSSDPAVNTRLRRLRVRWTVPKSRFWSAFPWIAPPGGDFVVEATIGGHGAWGEWSTPGWVETDQEGYTGAGIYGYFTFLRKFAVSVAIRRHTLTNMFGSTQPGDRERVDLFEIQAAIHSYNILVETENAVATYSESAYQKEYGDGGQFYLRSADADALLAGQTVTLPSPYSPDGTGRPSSYGFGTLEIQAIGPP